MRGRFIRRAQRLVDNPGVTARATSLPRIRAKPRRHQESNAMIREILRMGDPRLLRIAAPVPGAMYGSAELAALVGDMFDTMQDAGGVGLAAPQIGIDLQLVIFGFEASARYPDAPGVPRTILLNPVITPLSQDREEGWEGCLSVPGLRGVVERHSLIRYTGVDPAGEPIDRTADGFHARVVQHECDHLIGKLYPMRITDFSRFGYVDVLFPGMDPDADA
jgi:peptide deformylase